MKKAGLLLAFIASVGWVGRVWKENTEVNQCWINHQTQIGKRVCVIGAGPSGLFDTSLTDSRRAYLLKVVVGKRAFSNFI